MTIEQSIRLILGETRWNRRLRLRMEYAWSKDFAARNPRPA